MSEQRPFRDRRSTERLGAVLGIVGTTALVGGLIAAVVLLQPDSKGTKPPGDAERRAAVPSATTTCGEHFVFTAKAPPIEDRAAQQAVVEAVEGKTFDGITVRFATPSHVGVVAAVRSDEPEGMWVSEATLEHAQDLLGPRGVDHVVEWYGEPEYGESRQEDAVTAVQQVLMPLAEKLGKLDREAGYAGLATWQEGGAMVLDWKEPVPERIAALAGTDEHGVTTIVHGTRYSEKDLQDALDKAQAALDDGTVKAVFSMGSSCGDGSGILIGVLPRSYRGRGPALEEQLTAIAGVPVHVVAQRFTEAG